jgi:2-keto-3-deoxy-6-phosphogluconate aldolase
MFPEVILIPVGGLNLEDVQPMFELGMDAVGLGGAISTASDEELQTLFSRFS